MKSIKFFIKFAILALVYISVLSKHKRRLKRGSVDYQKPCTPHWWPRNDCKEGLTCDIEEKICKVSKNMVCGKGREERECADAEHYFCLPPPEVFGKNGKQPDWICREAHNLN